ncbi:MAG: hypothetical protein IRZ16_11770 [Myxococcaceae bacterium]|nr:hypothetical protein [Myxococcaceae bacterium]
MQRVALPVDSQGFVRRECPRCRRQFKVRGGPTDGAIVQRYLGRHLSFENHQEIARDDVRSFCPYCGYEAPADEWCTPQQRAWLEKVADVLGREIRYEQLQYPWRTLGANPGPTFVAVPPPDRLPEMRSEDDDLRRFSLFCCAEDVKVDTAWAQPIFCPRCGSEHTGGHERRIELHVDPLQA